MADNEAVVFGFPQPDGTVIYKSNDPYWNAEQLLKNRPAPAPESNPDDEDLGNDDGDDPVDEFEGLNGKQLKAKATALGVDITGLTKVGQVRQALRDFVAAQQPQADPEQAANPTPPAS